MLYLLDVDIDYAALGDRKAEILEAEWAATERLIERNVAVAEWRKASGTGVIAVWDCASRAELSELLRSIPLADYLRNVAVTPLVDHPLWPNGRLRPTA
jgi:muconolactone delta-isomerase